MEKASQQNTSKLITAPTATTTTTTTITATRNPIVTKATATTATTCVPTESQPRVPCTKLTLNKKCKA